MSCALHVVIGLINCFLWYWYGRLITNTIECNDANNSQLVEGVNCSHLGVQNNAATGCFAPREVKGSFIMSVPTEIIAKYRLGHLSELKLPLLDSLVLSNYRSALSTDNGLQECGSYINPLVSIKQSVCFAVAFVNDHHAYNLQRVQADEKEQHDEQHEEQDQKAVIKSTKNVDSIVEYGFFDKVTRNSHRLVFNDFMRQFLVSYGAVRSYISGILTQHSVHPGDDAIVMIVNEGEIDLFMNYVCSLHINNVTNRVKTIVFVTSPNLMPIVQSIGAHYIPVYHKQFVKVGKDANEEYLDQQFGRIMWYKLFSNWLLIDLGYNILYQDVDIIWLQDALSKAISHSHESFSQSHELHAQEQDLYNNTLLYDGYFSDDGQRTLRFAPFFINSGFYYLKCNSRTKYFTWSMLAAYDYLLVTSSHQFLFNMKLLESLDYARLSPVILNINNYPTGIKYNHDKPYMKGFNEGIIKPYMYHMCWTVNKDQKISNFKSINHWYIRRECSVVSKMYTYQGISRFQDCCSKK